jgi:hypothetical protein
MGNPLRLFRGYSASYTPKNFKKLLRKQRKSGEEREKLYDTSITAAFQDLLNRSPTFEERAELGDYLFGMDYRSAPMVTSALTERIAFMPEFSRRRELYGPMTPAEETNVAQFGPMVVDPNDPYRKTGLYKSYRKPINPSYT